MANKIKSTAKASSASAKLKEDIKKRYEIGLLTGKRDGIKLVALMCEGYVAFIVLLTIVIWVAFSSILALYLTVAVPSLIIILAAGAMEIMVTKKEKAIKRLRRELDRHH